MNTTETTQATTASRTRGRRADAAPSGMQSAAELEITTLLHATGVLFNIDPGRIAQMKNDAVIAGADPDALPNFPCMSGSLQDEHGNSIRLSMFMGVAQETGAIYASLSLGAKGHTRFYGKLFRQSGDAVPDYSGFIVVLPVTQREQYSEAEWEAAPRLQVCGWKRRCANGQARISLTVAPRVVHDSELPL